MKCSVVVKNFGNKKLVLGSQVYKNMCVSCLLKLYFFGYDHSIFEQVEAVCGYDKLIVVHIRLMDRIIKIFKRHGKLNIILKMNCGQEYTCAAKVVVRKTSSGKQGIGYILNSKTILMESGARVSMANINLPMSNKD